ncbi:MAG: ABC transporter substrate-binding protein, partial [Acetobacteraceae bacterium]
MDDLTRRGLLRVGTAGVAALAVPSGPTFAQATVPKRGGTVVLATEQAPPSLDAQITSAQAARNINLHMYETLYARDENAQPVPDLAQGVQISKDALTYAFTLRPGVHFHNGKMMGASDVVASLERYRKVGASPALLGAVDRIEASGPLEVTIRLTRGQSSFIDSISSPRAPIAIYPAEEAGKPLKDFAYVGTGPFKFGEYAPDSHVTLQRFDGYTPNPDYTKRDGFAGRKEVFVDAGTWRFMPESGARLAALETGEATIVETVNGPQAKQLTGKPAYDVLKVLPFLLQVFKFNHAMAPCDDPNFRRAVAACLNLEETMAIAHPDIYELDGGWVFPNSPYHTKDGLDQYNQNDPAKAKALLAKSSYKGEKLVFIVDNSGSDADTATDITQQLGQIGVTIDLRVADWPTVSKIGAGPSGWHFWTHGFGIEPYEGPATVMGVWVNGLSQQKDDKLIDKLFADFE